MKLPILNYHGLEARPGEYAWKEEETPYVIDAAVFSGQLETIRKKGLKSIGLQDLLQVQENQVMITFDDGLASQYEHGARILKEQKMKAIFFIPVNLVGQKGHASWQDLQAMVRDGFEMGSHGLHHRPLLGLPESEIREELSSSRKILEDRLGISIKSFSIPRGYFNDSMRRIAKESGYEFLFTSTFDVNETALDFYWLKRLVVKRATSSAEFVQFLEGNLGWKRNWEKMKEMTRSSVPPALYDGLAFLKRRFGA